MEGKPLFHRLYAYIDRTYQDLQLLRRPEYCGFDLRVNITSLKGEHGMYGGDG